MRFTPVSASPGDRDFPRVIPLFAFPEDIRRVIYTTNAIESVNMTLRHP
jgi:transposase-like protein